ncbi:MAG: riboflavin synthase [Candidatus Margulisbacteria bacterium]|nr:riboflavin synthase [Candidatus Margulisiibacteriota bacterium]
MFTGLIEDIGRIETIRPYSGGLEVVIATTLSDISIGDSVALNGICSTAISIQNEAVTFQYMKESLDKTTLSLWRSGGRVNLERCLLPTDRLGGHIVSGHVDTVGRIESFVVAEPWGNITISFDKQFGPYVIDKGSIVIDGISLTINSVSENNLSCALIPHTISHTVLQYLKPGGSVNLEFDSIGKYLYRFWELSKRSNL